MNLLQRRKLFTFAFLGNLFFLLQMTEFKWEWKWFFVFYVVVWRIINLNILLSLGKRKIK